MIIGVLQELRTALRGLYRHRWYALPVMVVTALSIACAGPALAIIDGVLFKPLPYPHLERLFAVSAGFRGDGEQPDPVAVSAADIASWTNGTDGTQFTGYSANPGYPLDEQVNEQPTGTARVQQNFFDVIGVHPLIGGFAATDFEQQQRIRPVIITDQLWFRRFGRSPATIGQTFILDASTGAGFRVAGVMPRGFVFPAPHANVTSIMPYVITRAAAVDPNYRVFPYVVARSNDDSSAAILRGQIEARMLAVAQALPPRGSKPSGLSERAWERLGPFDRATVQPLSKALTAPWRSLFVAVLLAVSALLVIAGINASSLMATRVMERMSEFAQRRAIGASAFAIARLVGVEAVVLILAGGAIGGIFAGPILTIVVQLLPDQMVLYKTPAIDGRVVALLLVGLFLHLCLVSVWPIRRTLGATAGSIIETSRRTARTRGTAPFVLQALQVAGALVLTVVGSLLVASVLTIYSNSFPFKTTDVVVIATHVLGPGGVAEKSVERAVQVGSVLERLRSVEGVEGASATAGELFVNRPPASWPSPQCSSGGHWIDVDVQGVTKGYFQVLPLRLLSGRIPSADELESGARVVIISESVARACWPDGSALGRTVRNQESSPGLLVVGIVGDVRWRAWDQPTATVYGPYGLLSRAPYATFLVRTHVGTAPIVEVLRQADPLLKPTRASPMDDLLLDSIRTRRLRSWLFGVFAFVSLVVVGVGVLGTVAMRTTQRLKELAIRQALGATRLRVVAQLVGQQMSPIIVGIITGSVVALGIVRLIRAELYGVTAYDASAWLASVGLILTATGAGVVIPALKAARQELRYLLAEQ